MDRVKPLTLAEIGRLAGVSAATVSRALADSPLVNPATREKIRDLAAAHDFRPNLIARRLRTGSAGLIAIVIPLGHEKRQHISDPFFMAMLGHLADRLTESGRDILLSRVIPSGADWLDRIIAGGMIDGVLLIGQSDQYEAIERVASRYRPLVVWGAVRPGQTHCAVGTDNVEGGRIAARHLIERGARRLAFMGDIRAPELEMRYRGCAEAAAETGLAPPLLLRIGLATDTIEAEARQLLERHLPDFDGVVAASDVAAMTLVRVLADRGIAVPDQVRLIGYDDLPLAVRTVPRLSTIRQDIAKGADAMVDALFRRLRGEPAPSLVMAPELVVRETS